MPDSGQKLEELFIKLRRYPQESFATWAVRVMEAYKNVQRSLARVRQDKAPPLSTGSSPTGRKSKPESVHSHIPRSSSEPHGEPPSPSRSPGHASRTQGAAEPTEPAEEGHATTEEAVAQSADEEGGVSAYDDWYAPWTWQDWKDWSTKRWWDRDDSSEDENFEDDLTWADLENTEVEVLPQEVLGWILLRRAGLSASARLSVQAAAHNSLRFDDVERALRDQQEELLMSEAQAHKHAGPRRMYWVEDGDNWGLIADSAIDEDALATEEIHWTAAPPPMQSAPEPFADDDTFYDGMYEWTYWNDEWHAQLEDGSFVAYSDMKPWLEVEDIAYEDAALGKELHDLYMAIDQKVRTFREAKQAVYQKGKNRGYFKPKGSSKGKGKKGFNG